MFYETKHVIAIYTASQHTKLSLECSYAKAPACGDIENM